VYLLSAYSHFRAKAELTTVCESGAGINKYSRGVDLV
jgi:hypothetical protein